MKFIHYEKEIRNFTRRGEIFTVWTRNVRKMAIRVTLFWNSLRVARDILIYRSVDRAAWLVELAAGLEGSEMSIFGES